MPEFPSPPASRGGRCRRQRGASPASLVPPKAPLVCSRWLGSCWFRHSCGGRNPGDLWGSRALPMFDGARSCAVRGGLWWAVGRMGDLSPRLSHRWAVAWIPASAGMTDRAPTAPTELIFNTVALSLRDLSPRSARGEPKPAPAQAGGRGGLARQPRATEGPPCMFALAREVLVPSFLRRQESRRSVGVKGAPNVRRRPIMRGALGALVGRRADGRSSHRWAVAWIPASAGMTDRAPTAPTELIFNTVALSLRDISPRTYANGPAEAGPFDRPPEPKP